MAEVFWSWSRSPMFQLGLDPVTGSRLQAELPIELIDALKPTLKVGGKTKFELVGPGDITGLDPAAITLRVPPPGTPDATQTFAAHVEFAEPDLPWRYTPERSPQAAPPNDGLKPWLVLVVGDPNEIVLGRRGTVEIRDTALVAHNLAESHRWAHVHQTGGRDVARLLCPRTLDAEREYIAVLVPAYTVSGQLDAAKLNPAWTAVTPVVRLPCFDSWRFRTGELGDFADIAARLRPIAAPPNFGVARAWLRAGDPPPDAVRDPLGGALTRVVLPQPLDAAPLDQAITDRIRVLTGSLKAPDGRWLLTLPDYGGPWPRAVPGPPPANGWRDQLASDPRRRGAAGLGAWAGIEWQRKIADAAAAQAGALNIAAQRIRHLTFGLSATRSLWQRRLPPDTAPVARLAILAPALARLPSGTVTVADELASRTPRLGPELFSTAARRALRAGPARTALAAPGATHPVAVFTAAGACPPPAPPDRLTERLQELAGVGGGHWQVAFEALVNQARQRAGNLRDQVDLLINLWRQTHAGPPSAELIAALQNVSEDPQTLVALREAIDTPSPSGQDQEAMNRLFRFPPAIDDCRPVNMPEVGRRVAAAFDPTVDRPLIVDRVLATIKGLREPVLAPPDVSPELDLPLWSFLSERAPDWLLPGIGDLGRDRMVAVASNPVFVDAFLIGANVQSLGELRWRNIPITTGWTPLRRFWLRIDLAAGGPATDIRPIGGPPLPGWDDGSALGAQDHAPPGQLRSNLVVVFRTDLFRRYPATLVYLAKALVDINGQPDWTKESHVDAEADATPRVWPVLTGTIGTDVVFFGFPVPPDAGADHWVVLEEPPHGVRFRTVPPPDENPVVWNQRRRDAANGAEYANRTYARQVRAFMGKLLTP